jgi:hypothetical protein
MVRPLPDQAQRPVSRYLHLVDERSRGTQTARVMLTDWGIVWSDLGISRLHCS